MNEHECFRPTNHGPRATHQPYSSNPPMEKPPLQTKTPFCEKNSVPDNANSKTESVRNFRDLKVWQMAKEIAVIVYKTTRSFPQEELYGLSSQMRRAAVSISSNIAEGFNRFYKNEYRRFLLIALGSCGELESQVEIGTTLNYVSKEVYAELIEKLNHENRMLRKLHSKMGEKQESVARGT